MNIAKAKIENLECWRMENESLALTVCPAVGGRLVSLKLKGDDAELLWQNPGLKLTACTPGDAYDPNFFGGVDELLPNDEAETIDGRDYLDHGELWTAPLDCTEIGQSLKMSGRLEKTGFSYEKTIFLDGEAGRIFLDYRIGNLRQEPAPFLWKLHAAMKLRFGDQLVCPARKGEIADAEFTGRHGARFFDWPLWNGERLDEVAGPESGRCEFFYLSELKDGVMALESPAGGTFFKYSFDTKVFPYAWYFATYGGWNNLYTGVLEPATAVPTALSKSIADKTCPILAPGEILSTRVVIEAGRL